jgi:polar amino acid transport system permease protein
MDLQTLQSTFFNLDIIRQMWPLLLSGLWRTLILSLVGIPLGLLAGIILAALSTSRSVVIGRLRAIWVDVFRAIPPLVLLILLYSGLPFVGINIPAALAVIIVIILNTGAYYGEILRAGVESISRGQVEAARSSGLSQWQSFIYIVLPQAIRNVFPDLISNSLQVVQLTSIAAVVAIPELLFQAKQIQAITFNATPIVAAAGIYFVMLWPVVRLISYLENRALAYKK